MIEKIEIIKDIINSGIDKKNHRMFYYISFKYIVENNNKYKVY